MEIRINIITLGVKDIQISKKFYENIGLVASSVSNEHMVAFQTAGIVLSLYPSNLLAEDAHITDSETAGFRGAALAWNVSDKNEVQSALSLVEKFGAKIIKPAQDVFWGGYSGYFADPDGHLWEVAWNPFWPLNKDGLLHLPK